MKTRDEAIEAVRVVRHEISAEHQHNTRLLIRHYQEMDKLYADRMLPGAGPTLAPLPKADASSSSPQ